ncbi:deubiquitinase DESI2-like [Tribolium madens]|uniref:deubiquitinase DESI2-like n=1 Tax=Tribolium madens TaxID=41895 RepID=UPI001CF743FC|nr:deubiquitinase DESI2-like [Tribolium madens]
MPCNPCGLHQTDSDEIPFEKNLEPVLLNIYDMFKINDFLGLGVFHSGVEIYGIEYGFAGHQNNTSGIFEIEPRNEQILEEFFNMHNGQLKYRETLHIGDTDLTRDEIARIVVKLGRKFRGIKYHLIYNNCNHFSATFTKLLCKKTIPNWVNRLAYLGSFIPCLHKLLPDLF